MTNIVHSLDAAPMMRTVYALWTMHTVKHFAAIHDSFGIHACNIPVLRKVLRQEFVAIHQLPLLVELLEAQIRAIQSRRDANEEVVEALLDACQQLRPRCPSRGSLNVDCVLDSEYLFS